MTDAREWFSSASGRRITATEIAKHLGISRNTAQARLNDGLSADDLIALSRALGVRPVDALVEIGPLESDEVFEWLDSDGQLLATATEADLAIELVARLAPEVIEERPVEPTPMPTQRKVLHLEGVPHAASRREKEMYPETPDDGL